MNAPSSDKITRDSDKSIDALWADFNTLWGQYQSWQAHSRLLADSHDKLNMVSPEIAVELKRLLGDNNDLEKAGTQLRLALNESTLELEVQRAFLNPQQKADLDKVKTRLGREQILRDISHGREHERER